MYLQNSADNCIKGINNNINDMFGTHIYKHTVFVGLGGFEFGTVCRVKFCTEL